MNLSKRFVESETGYITFSPSLCKSCGFCIQICPMEALHWSDEPDVNGNFILEINAEKCVSCGVCQRFCSKTFQVERKMNGVCMACAGCEWVCTANAIYIDDSLEYVLNPQKCKHCGDCFRACPTGALSKKAGTFW